MSLSPQDPVVSIPGIGPAMAAQLAGMSIHSVWDMLWHFPRAYEDRRQLYYLGDLAGASSVPQSKVRIDEVTMIHTRSGKQLLQAKVSDETAQIKCIWFNQPYLLSKLKRLESCYLVAGSFEDGTWINPQVIIADNDESVKTIVPIYSSTAKLSQHRWRSWYRSLFTHLIPLPILKTNHGQIDLSKCMSELHTPSTLPINPHIHQQLALFSHLLFALASQLRSLDRQHRSAFQINSVPLQPILNFLPFTLTTEQYQAIEVIAKDMAQPHPMNRLLQGDVGSGKSVVAQLAAYLSIQSGFQVLGLFPTELLASQQYHGWKSLFDHLNIEVGLATRVKKTALNSPIVLGTHALFSQDWQGSQIGLVIIDEQHRFGVAQRAFFESLPSQPHILTMSATPIPRTLAKTLAGDLSLTTITSKPTGRKPIKTWVVPSSKRMAAFGWIKTLLDNGQQAYVIYPLIDESELKTEVKAATKEFEVLSDAFSPYRVGLVHGKMSSTDKQSVFADFSNGKISVLVATSVVEVGVDVPQATVIMIEAADRFGLSQLHQLRGRVGRGELQSYCLLFASTDTQTDNHRLQALAKYNSGFELAKIDLKERGPGEVFGLSQHGFLSLSYEDLTNSSLHNQATQMALELIDTRSLKSYPYLSFALEPFLDKPSTSKS